MITPGRVADSLDGLREVVDWLDAVRSRVPAASLLRHDDARREVELAHALIYDMSQRIASLETAPVETGSPKK